MGNEDIVMMIEQMMLLIAAAGALAMVCGALLGEAACKALDRRSIAASMLASTQHERLLLRVKAGVRPLRAPAAWLLERSKHVDEATGCAVEVLADRGMDLSKEALLSTLIGLSLVSCALGWMAFGSPVFGIALGCIVTIGTMSYARMVAERRDAAAREKIPEVLRALCMSFRSGHSLPQALSGVARESDGHLAQVLSIASDRLEMGASTTEALSVMRGNRRLPELSFVAVALDVQHESGGSIAPVLESAIESVESELKLMRSLKVQTAQARLSAAIVTIMPFLLVALFSLMSPDFLSPFFSSLVGMALLSLALAMQCAGVIITRRMLKIEAG